MEPTNWQEVLGWGDEQLEDLRNEGYSYLVQGLYPQAITLFEAMVEVAPESSFDHQTLGGLYLQTGRYQEALDALDRALAIAPGNLPAQLNRSKALFALGRVEEGLSLARRLTRCREAAIREIAQALVMAYG